MVQVRAKNFYMYPSKETVSSMLLVFGGFGIFHHQPNSAMVTLYVFSLKLMREGYSVPVRETNRVYSGVDDHQNYNFKWIDSMVGVTIF